MISFRYDGITFEAKTVPLLRTIWQLFLDQNGLGSRDIVRNPRVKRDGKPIGWLTYNGRVWSTDPSKGALKSEDEILA